MSTSEPINENTAPDAATPGVSGLSVGLGADFKFCDEYDVADAMRKRPTTPGPQAAATIHD